MLRCIIMQEIASPLGTQLRRSKQACFNKFSFPRIIYLTSVVCFKSSFSFFFLRKEKACHSLTGYIIVKFMLFCNLETNYRLAHLIKHLKQNGMVPDFYGVCGQWAVEGAVCSV